MTQATRRAILAVVTGIVLLALGLGAAVVVGDALGIRTEPAAQMQPAAPASADVADPVAPPEFTNLDVPDTERLKVAVAELTDAVASASARSGTASLRVTLLPTLLAETSDGYTLEGDATALRVTALSENGATRAIYDLAAHVRAARPLTDLLGTHEPSRLPLRMT